MNTVDPVKDAEPSTSQTLLKVVEGLPDAAAFATATSSAAGAVERTTATIERITPMLILGGFAITVVIALAIVNR